MKTSKLKLACSEILSEQRTVKRIVILCVDMEHARIFDDLTDTCLQLCINIESTACR